VSLEAPVALAGVDGCKAGWIAVQLHPGQPPQAGVFAAFADILAALPADAIIVVDMPIGLPAHCGHGGRGPEAIVRRLLGERQSSVFSIPSRAAVYAAERPFTTLEDWYADHRACSAVARATSDPPRSVSIQGFALFPRIREIDRLLIADETLRGRIVEGHPELAFWRLAGGRAMSLPKKAKGVPYPPGMEQRRALLCAHGFDRDFLDRAPPRGAAEDDVLDAAAMLAVAARHARGETAPFPDPPGRDEYGIPVAITA
jgi:predicted RNase H-like nuclease